MGWGAFWFLWNQDFEHFSMGQNEGIVDNYFCVTHVCVFKIQSKSTFLFCILTLEYVLNVQSKGRTSVFDIFTPDTPRRPVSSQWKRWYDRLLPPGSRGNQGFRHGCWGACWTVSWAEPKGQSRSHRAVSCRLFWEKVCWYYLRCNNNTLTTLIVPIRLIRASLRFKKILNFSINLYFISLFRTEIILCRACVAVLLLAGSDMECDNDFGNSPLHAAVRNGRYWLLLVT